MKHSHAISPLSRETFTRYSPPISQDSPPIQKSPVKALVREAEGLNVTKFFFEVGCNFLYFPLSSRVIL